MLQEWIDGTKWRVSQLMTRWIESFFWKQRFTPLQLDGNPTTDASAVGNSAEHACDTRAHSVRPLILWEPVPRPALILKTCCSQQLTIPSSLRILGRSRIPLHTAVLSSLPSSNSSARQDLLRCVATRHALIEVLSWMLLWDAACQFNYSGSRVKSVQSSVSLCLICLCTTFVWIIFIRLSVWWEW